MFSEAISPATPMAHTAHRHAWGSSAGAAPTQQPTTTAVMQPEPVMRVMSGSPLLTAQAPLGWATISMRPLTTTMASVAVLRSWAMRAAAPRFSSETRTPSSASTPRAVAFSPARKRISELLPLMTVKRTSCSRVRRVSLRRSEAPAPTGSSTTGIFRALARLPAASMEATVRALSVPMLMTSAELRLTICSTSAASSAIMGEPPAARIMLAQSLTVT